MLMDYVKLCQALAQLSEASGHAGVDELVAYAGDDTAQYARVFVDVELDGLAARDRGELVSDAFLVGGVEGIPRGHTWYPGRDFAPAPLPSPKASGLLYFGQGLVYEAIVVGCVERLADDLAGGHDRQTSNLPAQLVLGTLGVHFDLLVGV